MPSVLRRRNKQRDYSRWRKGPARHLRCCMAPDDARRALAEVRIARRVPRIRGRVQHADGQRALGVQKIVGRSHLRRLRAAEQGVIALECSGGDGMQRRHVAGLECGR